MNVDLKNRCDKDQFQSIDIVRIGTCGILQPEVSVHSYILSTHAFGLDNVAHYYELSFKTEEEALRDKLHQSLGLPEEINTYLVESNKRLISKLSSEKTHKGITITSSGFYGPQGRQLRLKTKTKSLNEHLTNFQDNDLKVMNFEMESSALFALGRALGHSCATICLGIANRPNMAFSKGYEKEMMGLIEYVLDRI